VNRFSPFLNRTGWIRREKEPSSAGNVNCCRIPWPSQWL